QARGPGGGATRDRPDTRRDSPPAASSLPAVLSKTRDTPDRAFSFCGPGDPNLQMTTPADSLQKQDGAPQTARIPRQTGHFAPAKACWITQFPPHSAFEQFQMRPARSGARLARPDRETMQTANEIRRTFLEYFAANGHAIVPSSPLVPRN